MGTAFLPTPRPPKDPSGKWCSPESQDEADIGKKLRQAVQELDDMRKREGKAQAATKKITEKLKKQDALIIELGGETELAQLVADTNSPGVYCISHQGTYVGSSVDALENDIGTLDAGTVVNLLEVVHREDLGRFRARVEEPAGWISI